MISAVINTYNEEKNIEKCLSSLASWVSEIIIVDMNSSDNTVKIAKGFTDKIYSFPYIGFVEPARNMAIGKAHGDWIILVDADEEIPKSLSSKIKDLISKTDCSYFRIPRKNIIFSKWIRHASWWPDYQIRLFKKGAVSWSDKIHSIPLTRGQGSDLTLSEENAIVHYNYQSVEQFIERLNRYTSIQAKELYISGKKFSWQSLIHSPTQEFLSRYFQSEGYKDGIHGLILSLMQSFSQLSVMIKLWELEGAKESRIDLSEFKKELDARNSQENYYLIEEKMSKEKYFLPKLKLKIERKLRAS